MNRRDALRWMSTAIGLSAVGSGGGAQGDEPQPGPERVRHRPDIRLLRPHPRIVTAVAFSPDGSRLVTAADGEPLRAWEAESGHPLPDLGRHPVDARRIVFSPDGRRIAASGPGEYQSRPRGSKPRGGGRASGSMVVVALGGLIRVWDAQTGREVADIRGERSFDALAFEPDAAHLTTLDAENLLQSWEIDGARVFQAVKGAYPEGNRGRSVSPRCVAIDARARRAVVAAYEANGTCGAEFCPTLKFWDLDASRYRESYGLSLRSCLLSPDGRLLVLALDANPPGTTVRPRQVVSAMDFNTGKVLREARTDYEQPLLFSPDGRRFVTAREDGVLHLWDVAAWRVVREIRGPEPFPVPGQIVKSIAVRALVFRPHGLRVASGGLQGWNEVDERSGEIKRDPITGEVLKVEPLQIWDVALD
jgi:WD40 repeat protein